MPGFNVYLTPQPFTQREEFFIYNSEYAQSESDFLKAEQLDPGAEANLAARSLAALQQNNLPEAEATIRQRLRQNPRDSFLYYFLAETLARKGAAVGSAEFADAISAASMAVKLRPDFALARDVLGRLYLEKGNVDGAVEQSRLAVRANPADQTALYHLILALRKAHKSDAAARLVPQLIALREQARKREANEHKYMLVEQSAAAESNARP